MSADSVDCWYEIRLPTLGFRVRATGSAYQQVILLNLHLCYKPADRPFSVFWLTPGQCFFVKLLTTTNFEVCSQKLIRVSLKVFLKMFLIKVYIDKMGMI